MESTKKKELENSLSVLLAVGEAIQQLDEKHGFAKAILEHLYEHGSVSITDNVFEVEHS